MALLVDVDWGRSKMTGARKGSERSLAYRAEEASLDPSLSEKDEVRTRSVSEVVVVDLAHDGVVPDDDILSLSSLCRLLEGSAGRRRSVSPQPSRRTQRLSSRRKGLRLTVVRYESYSA